MNDTEFEDHLQRTSTYQRSFHFVDVGVGTRFNESISSIRTIISINQFRGIGLNLASTIFFFSFAQISFLI